MVHQILWRWVAFNAVGALGVAVQLLTLIALTEWLGLDYLLSTALAVETAVLHNFWWHERWTWRDRVHLDPGGIWARLVRFNLTGGALSIPGNVLFTRLFTIMLGTHYVVANLMAIGICSILNFAAAEWLIFRGETEAATPQVSFSTTSPSSEEVI